MQNASPQTAASIRARVHDSALRRVTRFFSSTPVDVFSELLQNARRAGANCVGVDTEGLSEREGGGIRVTVTDDGTGVGDAAVLLSFGETGWDEANRTQRGCRRHGPGLAGPARLPRVLAPGRVHGRSRSRLAHRTQPGALPRRGNRHSAHRRRRAVSERDRRLVQGGRDPGGDRGGHSPARRCIIRWP